MNDTPPSLLERLRRPNAPDAWGRFAELYTPLIFSWVLRQGLQQADAADLVQDVFVTLVQAMPQFQYDAGRSFRGWLRTVTLNKVRERRRKATPIQAADALLDGLADNGATDTFWEVEYRQQLARRALDILRRDFEPATWEAFWQHGVLGRPAPHVAAELKVSPGAVRAALCRVRGRLQQELAGLLD
jgi:RNA polymerase sigma-70 factor (ECF subfamily)